MSERDLFIGIYLILSLGILPIIALLAWEGEWLVVGVGIAFSAFGIGNAIRLSRGRNDD